MLRIDLRSMSLSSAIVLGACNQPNQTYIHMERMDEGVEAFGSYFRDMADNALLRDMSIADLHFIAHTDELSGVGAERLDRMAALLQTYGGTVRYETYLADEDMVQRRIGHVREYLTLVGCNMDRVSIAVQAPGGRGMRGDEAVRQAIEGTASGVLGGGSDLTSGSRR